MFIDVSQPEYVFFPKVGPAERPKTPMVTMGKQGLVNFCASKLKVKGAPSLLLNELIMNSGVGCIKALKDLGAPNFCPK